MFADLFFQVRRITQTMFAKQKFAQLRISYVRGTFSPGSTNNPNYVREAKVRPIKNQLCSPNFFQVRRITRTMFAKQTFAQLITSSVRRTFFEVRRISRTMFAKQTFAQLITSYVRRTFSEVRRITRTMLILHSLGSDLFVDLWRRSLILSENQNDIVVS